MPSGKWVRKRGPSETPTGFGGRVEQRRGEAGCKAPEDSPQSVQPFAGPEIILNGKLDKILK